MAHNGAEGVVGLRGGPLYNQPIYINVCKQAAGTLPWYGYTSGGSLVRGENWQASISTRMYPTEIPDSIDQWRTSQLWMDGQDGEVWVLDWTGTATLTLVSAATGGSLTENVINSNRKEYTVSGPPVTDFGDGSSQGAFLVYIRIDSLAQDNFEVDGDIRLYRKSDETRLATSPFREEFIDLCRGFGILRMMDAQSINPSDILLNRELETEGHFAYAGGSFSQENWAGLATKTKNTYSMTRVAGAPTSWTHGQPVFFEMPIRPDYPIVTVTQGNPTSIESTAHGLSTGDEVVFTQDGSGNWGTSVIGTGGEGPLPPVFTATVTDVDNYTIDLDSSALSAPSGTFRCGQVFQIKDDVLPPKRCLRPGLASHFNSEFSIYSSPNEAYGVYDGDFDVIHLQGDSAQGQTTGYPTESLVALAEEAGCHIWLCVPYMFNATETQNFLNDIEVSRPSWMTVYIEPGNEVWNNGSGFPATRYAVAQSYRLWGVASSSNHYGSKVAELADLLPNSNYKTVLAVQGVATGDSQIESRLQSPLFSQGDTAKYPGNKADVLALAPYVVTPFTFYSTAADYEGYVEAIYQYTIGNEKWAFQWFKRQLITPEDATWISTVALQEPLDEWIDTYVPAWRTVCDTYGLDLAYYEAGTGIAGPDRLDGGFPTTHVPSSTTITVQNVQDFIYAYLESQAEQEHVVELWDRSVAAGVDLPGWYLLQDAWVLSNCWGLQRYNSPNPTGTRRAQWLRVKAEENKSTFVVN